MKVIIYGINCSCGFNDDNVKFEDYLKWINKSCPKCGKNLLTINEFNECKTIYKIVSFIDKLKWINPFYYYRIIVGDKREINIVNIDWKDRKIL
jgi:hypothetical protein